MSEQNNQIPNFTVLHLCSAHILKAVSQAFGGKKNAEKSIKEYATFCFAHLINCTNIHSSLLAFYHMCMLFKAKEYANVVKESKVYLDRCVLQIQDKTFEEGETVMGE